MELYILHYILHDFLYFFNRKIRIFYKKGRFFLFVCVFSNNTPDFLPVIFHFCLFLPCFIHKKTEKGNSHLPTLVAFLENLWYTCDRKPVLTGQYTVKIPMYHGVDSLNVAAASAVAFWELRSR